MKNKQIILVIIGLLVSFLAFSQDKTGIKVGLNLTNLYVSDVDDENMKFGFNAGIYHRVDITDNFAFQPEFLFTQKGASIHYNGSLLNGSGTYRYNLNYLEIPLLFVIKLGDVNFHAGPYAALLAGANIKDVDDDGTINNFKSLDRDDFNTFDYGLSGGIAFDFEDGILGVRYNYGFNEIGESGSFAGQATRNSKNSALQLYMGFGF